MTTFFAGHRGIRLGCSGFGTARSAYAAEFTCVELTQTFFKPPPADVLARWRAGLPAGFSFAVTAWLPITHPVGAKSFRRTGIHPGPGTEGNYGNFQSTDEVLSAWEETRAAALALRAEWIVFQPPAGFAATLENISNLRSFLETIDRGSCRLAWFPKGDWPGDLTTSLYENLGLVRGIDPRAGHPPTRQMAYFRVCGDAPSSGTAAMPLADDDLGRIHAACLANEEPWVFFATPAKLEDARRLRALERVAFRAP